MTGSSDPLATRPPGAKLCRTISGCNANWTITISIERLDPAELGPSAANAEPPALPAGSLRLLDQVFQDGIDLYEYRLEMDHYSRR